MSVTSTLVRPVPGPRAWRRRILGGVALALALAMLVYGVLAISAGLSNWSAAGNAEIAAERRAIMAEADDPAHAGVANALDRVRYQTLSFVSAFSSDRYAYGSDGLMETLIHYSEMPKVNSVALVTHNILAGICLLFAGFQFWPTFRRKFPTWHRRFGKFYVLGIQTAMVAAVIYLSLTPVTQIYDHLTFAWILWFMAAGVTLSLWMAMFNLWRGNIPQHMGFMALNFGFLLTAPVLRGGWVLMGLLHPDARQIEGGFAVNAVLIPVSALIGYAIFAANRFTQPTRVRAALLTEASPWPLALRALIVMAAAAGVWLLLGYGLVNPGLAGLGLPPGTVPDGVLALDRAVLVEQPMSRWIFALSGIAGIVVGARALLRRASGTHGAAWLCGADRWWLVLAAAVNGVVQLHWGEQMGLPSFATLSAGTVPVFGGIVTLGFAALLALAAQKGWDDWADEWGGFVLACLFATPVFCVAQTWLASLAVAPAFREAGHLYRIAGVAQWVVLLIPFLFAIYGPVTARRLSR